MNDTPPAAPVILHREPWAAVWRRLGIRAAILASGVLVGGIPGIWGGVAGWPPLRVLGWLVAIVGLLFVFLSIANLARNDRALLALDESGAIRRPPSVQESWLGRPVESVPGADITVTEAIISVVPSRADPRVTLTAGEQSIPEIPLYGLAPEEFVSVANAALGDSTARLRYVPPAAPAD